MTAAQDLAWRLYINKVNALLDEQFQTWEKGERTSGLHLAVPSRQSLELIDATLKRAIAEGISAALSPIVRALDEIDNSRPKTDAAKQYRKELQIVYDTLHAMKLEAVKTPSEGR